MSDNARESQYPKVCGSFSGFLVLKKDPKTQEKIRSSYERMQRDAEEQHARQQELGAAHSRQMRY